MADARLKDLANQHTTWASDDRMHISDTSAVASTADDKYFVPADLYSNVASSGYVMALLQDNAKTFSASGTDDYIVSMSATLNNGDAGGSDVFRGIKLTVTATDSSGWDESYLVDLIVDGTSKLQIDLNGDFDFGAATPTITFGSTKVVDFGETAANDITLQSGGGLWVSKGGAKTLSGGRFDWTNSPTNLSAAVDTKLQRSAAGIVRVGASGGSGIGEIEADGIGVLNEAEGGTARCTRKSVRELVTLTGATKDTTINLASGVRLLGASFCVNTAVVDDAGDDTWSAEFHDGASMDSLASGAAAAQNTKVDTLIADVITDATTNIRFTPNAGNFSAGVIEVVVYYETLTSLANA